MSSTLGWRQVPRDPDWIGQVAHPAKGIILNALKAHSGDIWLEESQLVSDPVVVRRNSPVVPYLQGYADALGGTGAPADDLAARDELLRLLGAIDQYGEVQIGVIPL